MSSHIFCPFQGNISSLDCTGNAILSGLLLSLYFVLWQYHFYYLTMFYECLTESEQNAVILEMWWDLEMGAIGWIDRARHRQVFFSKYWDIIWYLRADWCFSLWTRLWTQFFNVFLVLPYVPYGMYRLIELGKTLRLFRGKLIKMMYLFVLSDCDPICFMENIMCSFWSDVRGAYIMSNISNWVYYIFIIEICYVF